MSSGNFHSGFKIKGLLVVIVGSSICASYGLPSPNGNLISEQDINTLGNFHPKGKGCDEKTAKLFIVHTLHQSNFGYVVDSHNLEAEDNSEIVVGGCFLFFYTYTNTFIAA